MNANNNPYAAYVRARNDAAARDGQRPRFFIHTYGCQMNARESEKLAGVLSVMGYEPATQETDAALVLYNTCCIRENAEQKILGNLSFSKFQKETNPDLTVVFCGCMAQQDAARQLLLTQRDYIDVLFGTQNRHQFPELLWRYFETGTRIVDITPAVSDEPESVTDAGALLSRVYKHKTGVSVMYGCDNFCAYCVVPYVRGRERSRELDDVLTEVSALAADGVREIMLLGQNVNAYGKGLREPASFAELLWRVNDVPGLARVRFMTSHPKDFSTELIYAIRDSDRVCKAVHLPLQSGSTQVLTAMNRRYTKESYLRLAERIQTEIPGVALSTDIIVGFPGETEADFQDTLDVVRRTRFAGAFTFIFSKRSGTPAAKMPDTVPAEVATDRFNRLIEVINPILYARNTERIGDTLAVMVEEEDRRGMIKGRADDNTLVHFTVNRGAAHDCGTRTIPGDILPVRITEAKTYYLTGEAM